MPDAIKSGMVLAAGLGTRMRPLTLHTPKPLIRVAGRTMADHAIDRLIDAGVEKVVLNVSYLGEQIVDHFATRKDITIALSHEDEPLETGGGVFKALPELIGDAFFVLNGDAILVDGPASTLRRLAENWSDDIDVLLLLLPIAKATGYEGRGDFTLAENGLPVFRGTANSAPYVFSGTQILSRHAFAQKQAGKWSLREIYEEAIAQGRARAIIHDGDWLHVGTPEGLETAEDYFAKRA